MSDFDPLDLIAAKRDGQPLAPEAIAYLVEAYTAGDLPDYQMSAFLMAAYLRGLNEEEAAALTDAMLYSGTVLDLSDLPGTKVDKHSTGGVGDKVSLILAPVVAACGVPVPMISGRGLGHTGGTLDKLESIPGFRTDLSIDAYRQQLERLGVVIMGQTEEIAPADRGLYALRDVTATVDFIPFIAASIMSKKLAEGIDGLVLDVKCGRGAFMKTPEQARELAETLVSIGARFDKPSVALVTRMDVPLGRAVGNWPEVAESIRCLQGEDVPDLMEVTLALAGEMLALAGASATPSEGREQARQAIASGRAFDRFVAMVEAQGGDASVVRAPETRPRAEPAAEVRASGDARGYVAELDALRLGQTAVRLGAGRRTKEDPVDPTAGLVLNKKPGDPVTPNDLLAKLYTKKDQHQAYAAAVREAYTFEDARPAPKLPLMGRYTTAGWQDVNE